MDDAERSAQGMTVRREVPESGRPG